MEGEIIVERKVSSNKDGIWSLVRLYLRKDSLSGVVAVESRAGCREMNVKGVETVRHPCMTVSGGSAGTGEK